MHFCRVAAALHMHWRMAWWLGKSAEDMATVEFQRGWEWRGCFTTDSPWQISTRSRSYKVIFPRWNGVFATNIIHTATKMEENMLRADLFEAALGEAHSLAPASATSRVANSARTWKCSKLCRRPTARWIHIEARTGQPRIWTCGSWVCWLTKGTKGKVWVDLKARLPGIRFWPLRRVVLQKKHPINSVLFFAECMKVVDQESHLFPAQLHVFRSTSTM